VAGDSSPNKFFWRFAGGWSLSAIVAMSPKWCSRPLSRRCGRVDCCCDGSG
jgi:hypothetical protein